MRTSDPMPERRESRQALSGALIVLALLGLAIGIISLDEIVAERIETVDFAASLPAAGGLVSGAPVWIAGREVGEVVAVVLLPPATHGRSRVVATARIPAEHLPLLRRDSRARLTSEQIMGHPILEISPGSPAAPPLGPGDTVPAAYGPDRIGRALAGARAVLAEVDSLAAGLRQVAGLYGEGRPRIDALARSVARAAEELERARRTVRDGPLPAALDDARLAARLERVRDAVGDLRSGLARYAGGPLAESVDALGARADSLREALAALDSAATDPSASAGRLAADSALRRQAARAGAQLDSLSRELASDPLRFF